MTREKDIENYLRDEIKKIGGAAYKWVSPGTAGVPDRIVLLPYGQLWFVELKAPGNGLTKLQQVMRKKLEGLGYRYAVLDSYQAVTRFVAQMHQDLISNQIKARIHRSGQTDPVVVLDLYGEKSEKEEKL